MKVMIPFYCAVVSLFLGILGGFCAKCYQISKGEDFFKVLRISAWNLAKNSWTAFCLPVLILFSNEFRRLLLYVLIYEAEEDYTVSISEADKDSLVDVLLEKVSVYDMTRIAINLSLFYFINLDGIANSTMRKVSEKSQSKTMTFNLRRISFLKDLSFYKRNIFARTVFCL